MIPAALLAYGTGILIWVLFFGATDNVGNYYAYKSLAKLTVSAALLMLYFVSCPPPRWLLFRVNRMLVFTVYLITLLGIAAVSCYQYFYLLVDRVAVGSHIATMAAYMVSIAGLICVNSLSLTNFGYRQLILLSLIFMLTYFSIVMTGTRSTMLAFPFIFIVSVLMFRSKAQLLYFKKFIFILIIAIGVSSYQFGHLFKNRMDAVIVDINNYAQHDNSNTSMGARIAMYQTGFRAGLSAIWGESLQSRSESISDQVLREPKLSGATHYMFTNLHNDTIENFSLRGIWGVSLLFLIYFTIFYTAVKKRNPTLFAIGVSLILYGLTDVIFSDDLPLTYYMALIFSVYLSRGSAQSDKSTLG